MVVYLLVRMFLLTIFLVFLLFDLCLEIDHDLEIAIIFPNLLLDDRIQASSTEIIITKGVWGHINGSRIYCYSAMPRNKESFIIVYTKPERINLAIKIIHGR